MKLTEDFNGLQATLSQLKCKLETYQKKLQSMKCELEDKECRVVEYCNMLEVIFSSHAAVILFYIVIFKV